MPNLSPLIQSISNYVQSQISLNQKRILLHVSGGPDSIFLLRFITQEFGDELDFIGVLTINYRFRSQAKQEVQYVKECCEKWGVHHCEIYEPHVKVKPGCSIQDLSREIRMLKSDELVEKYAVDYVLLGHHRDDFLETMFLKMNRGASLSSIFNFTFLSGKYMRPLLNISKQDILKYLHEENILYFEDVSNTQAVYDRNKLRLEVFASMDTHFPHWRNDFYSSFKYFQQSHGVLKKMLLLGNIYQPLNKGFFLLPVFYELPNSDRELILHLLMSEFFSWVPLSGDFVRYLSEKVFKKKNILVYKNENTKVIFENSLMVVYEDVDFSMDIGLGQEVTTGGKVFHLDEFKKDKHLIDSNQEHILFSRRTPIDNLRIRNKKEGDKIYFEQVGHKPLKKFMSECGLPSVVRRCSAVVESGAEILLCYFLPVELMDDLLTLNVLKTERGHIVASNILKENEEYRYILSIRD